jgi:hypothetical protein
MQAHLSANTNRTPGRIPGWVLDGRNSLRAARRLLFYVYWLRVTFSAYNIFVVVVSPYAPPGKPPGVLFALSTNMLFSAGVSYKPRPIKRGGASPGVLFAVPVNAVAF